LPSTQKKFQVFARWFFHGFCCLSFLKYDVLSMWHTLEQVLPWSSKVALFVIINWLKVHLQWWLF
jgi:hypothetical protein